MGVTKSQTWLSDFHCHGRSANSALNADDSWWDFSVLGRCYATFLWCSVWLSSWPGSWSPLLSLSLSNPPLEVRSPPTAAAPHTLRKPCFPEERWHYYPSFVTSKPSMPLLVSRNCYVFTLEGSFINDAVVSYFIRIPACAESAHILWAA